MCCVEDPGRPKANHTHAIADRATSTAIATHTRLDLLAPSSGRSCGTGGGSRSGAASIRPTNR